MDAAADRSLVPDPIDSVQHIQCVCGRTFLQPGPLKKHLNSCSKSKKRLSSALVKAREVWTSRKKIRVWQESSREEIQPTPTVVEGTEGVDKMVCMQRFHPMNSDFLNQKV
jgi:hypothetical protein